MNTFNRLLFIFSLCLTIFSCTKEKATEKITQEPDNCPTILFATEVLPVFQNSCSFSGCHSSASSADGIALSTHSEVIAVNEQRLLNSIRHEGTESPMPQGGGKLSQDDIDKIACWIANGKPNN